MCLMCIMYLCVFTFHKKSIIFTFHASIMCWSFQFICLDICRCSWGSVTDSSAVCIIAFFGSTKLAATCCIWSFHSKKLTCAYIIWWAWKKRDTTNKKIKRNKRQHKTKYRTCTLCRSGMSKQHAPTPPTHKHPLTWSRALSNSCTCLNKNIMYNTYQIEYKIYTCCANGATTTLWGTWGGPNIMMSTFFVWFRTSRDWLPI